MSPFNKTILIHNTKRQPVQVQDISLLQDVNIELVQVDKVSVYGASGAGKATLLQPLVGTLGEAKRLRRTEKSLLSIVTQG